MTALALPTLILTPAALLLAAARHHHARPPLTTRLAHSRGTSTISTAEQEHASSPSSLIHRPLDHYERQLRQSGNAKTLPRLLAEKALLAAATPLIIALPSLAATGKLPTPPLMLLLAAGGFFIPDLLLANDTRRRREAIFLDLPETITVLALGLRAGQSLRQALDLAARDNPGAIGEELKRALTLARTQRRLDDRNALVTVAHETGEPTFARFAELLAVKESPYLEFLNQQAREARAEQSRYLERAADRAYLSMHAPLAPLLAVIVLLFAYGFLRYLANTV